MKSDLESNSLPQSASNLKLHAHISQYKSKLLKQIPVSTIQLSYHPEIPPEKRLKILDSRQAVQILRSLWNPDTLELQEAFKILFLNNSNQIIGLYPHSSGTITATITDIRLILIAALSCGAVAMILCHNHPSSNSTPSLADKKITEKLSKAAKTIDIKLLDHIIITKDSHYSFADNGEIDF